MESCRPAILENIGKSKSRGRWQSRIGWRDLSFRCKLKTETGDGGHMPKIRHGENFVRFTETFPAVISRDEKTRSDRTCFYRGSLGVVLISRPIPATITAHHRRNNRNWWQDVVLSFHVTGNSVLWTIKRACRRASKIWRRKLARGARGHGGHNRRRQVEQVAETRPQHVVLKHETRRTRKRKPRELASFRADIRLRSLIVLSSAPEWRIRSRNEVRLGVSSQRKSWRDARM